MCCLYDNPFLKVKKHNMNNELFIYFNINCASKDVPKIEFCEIKLIKYTPSIIYIVVIAL